MYGMAISTTIKAHAGTFIQHWFLNKSILASSSLAAPVALILRTSDIGALEQFTWLDMISTEQQFPLQKKIYLILTLNLFIRYRMQT